MTLSFDVIALQWMISIMKYIIIHVRIQMYMYLYIVPKHVFCCTYMYMNSET